MDTELQQQEGAVTAGPVFEACPGQGMTLSCALLLLKAPTLSVM